MAEEINIVQTENVNHSQNKDINNPNKKPKKKMNKNVRNYLIYIIILLVVTGFTVYFVLKDDPSKVFGYIQNSNYKFLIIAVLLVLCAFSIEGLILMILAKMYRRKYHWWQGILNCLIGEFFSAITPSASGGQFVQAYTFSKQKIKVTNAASILYMHFILYQSVLVLFSTVIFIWKFPELRAYGQTIPIGSWNLSIVSLAVIAFIINFSVIAGLFFLAFSKRLHRFVTVKGIGLLAKLHIVKNKDQKIFELNTKLETFRIELKKLLQNWKVIVICFVLFTLKLAILNAIPYFVIRALGGETPFIDTNEFNNVINCISMTLFSTTISSLIPIPGASGVTELVFKLCYDNLINGDGYLTNAIILVWRFITYYTGLILGFLTFILYRGSPRKESLHGNDKTMLQLRIIMVNEEKSLTMVDPEDAIESVNDDTEDITPQQIHDHFQHVKDELAKQLNKNDKAVDKELDAKKKGIFVSWRQRREAQLEKRREKEKAKREEKIRKAREAEEKDEQSSSKEVE